MAKTVLVVDDDPTQRRLIRAVLEREGFDVGQAENGEEALTALGAGAAPDVVILDLTLPGMSGMDTLKEMRARGVTAPVIVLTATGGVEVVVRAMQAGAQDFFIKPASPERIMVSIRNALQLGDLSAEVQRLKKRTAGQFSFDDLVGDSASMQQVKRMGLRAAKSTIPVLILGESGVGKEVIARAVHGASERVSKPFVAVNCGALPENLAESILFGHERGAFTGAMERHPGKFQEAHGGTLFLDEVGELPLDIQVKLLRALQEGEIDPIGAKRPVQVDVRIVSATNRNLAQAVKSGAFREDLYYRLNVFPLEAPPLRDRREDIPELVAHFVRRFNVEEGKRVLGVTAETLTVLAAYDWPGNVRQLENAVYRAIVLSEAPYLQPYDFPAVSGMQPPIAPAEGSAGQGVDGNVGGLNGTARDAPLRVLDEGGHLRKLDEIEHDLIQLAISLYSGHMSEVARRLGIGRSTLYRKVREHSLEGVSGAF